MQILNKKQVKEILNIIKKQWDYDGKLNYVFLKRDDSKRDAGKLFFINKDAFTIDHSKLRINSLGLYIAEIKGNEIRLSIEGSQLIGPEANKNVVEISDEQARSWLKGEDIEIEGNHNHSGFVIIKHNNDFLGSGKFRNNQVLNFVPKTRRVNY